MSAKIESNHPAVETVAKEGAKVYPNVFLVAETYSIQRRAKAELATTKQLPKYESTWLPKRAVQITLRSGFSPVTLFGMLLLASLVIYGAFTVALINSWSWLSLYTLTGVGSLAMIFGAQAIIGILFSVIEENDPVQVVGRFTQYIGSIVLFSGSFLVGGWLSTQWLRSQLSLIVGPTPAMLVSVLVLACVVQLILSGLVRTYRATAAR